MVLLFVLPALIFTYFWMSFSFFGRYCFVCMPCRTGSSIFYFFFPNNQTTYFLKGVGEKKKKEDHRKHQREVSKNRIVFCWWYAKTHSKLTSTLPNVLGVFESFVKLLAYQITCLWVFYLNSRCICSWHFKCKGASMKMLVRAKLYFPLKPQRVSRASRWTLQCYCLKAALVNVVQLCVSGNCSSLFIFFFSVKQERFHGYVPGLSSGCGGAMDMMFLWRSVPWYISRPSFPWMFGFF